MKKGATLIEFLVVIVIVGMLSAMVIASIPNKPSGQIGVAASTPVFPEPTDYVVDTSGVLSAETKASLDLKLKALDSKAQIAVVTIPSTEPLTIEEYSIKLAEQWKPGYKGKDNGIIFIIATSDRKMRIEVGRGLEGNLNDAKAGTILRDVVTPFFKAGDWNGGVNAGVDAIIKEINK